MQGVTVSSVGQSFSLPKCSASRENKSRIRRTKEERRTMVMSFIKKYQSSNNGKFPSLNLTHKEVGGSFYTIREIVRDIIQENKVLGPGNPSSKLLNLQYYTEEETDTSSFLDVGGNISISGIGNRIDHVHGEVDSSLELQEVTSDVNIEINKPGAHVRFGTRMNENFSWQVKNGETNLIEDSANGSVLHEELINSGTEESNVHSLTAKKDDAWGSDEQINTKVQGAKQSHSLYPTGSGNFLVESELTNEDTHNKISVRTNCFEENTNISETSVNESLPGTSMLFSDIVDDQSNGHRDNHGVLALVDDTLDQDVSSETVTLAVSNTPQIIRSAHKVHLPPEPFLKRTAIYSSELETVSSNSTFSSSETSSSANKGDVPFIPFDKEPFASIEQSREIASSSEQGIDVAKGQCMDNFVLQTTRSPAPGAAENDLKLVDKSSSLVDAVKESENASGKLLEPVIQEADRSDFKTERQHGAFSTVNGGDNISSSNQETNKVSEMSQKTPLWNAIKAFIASFIRFWSD
ncbi:uncharacterized protein LOC110101053 [Dendrobium catenatum]|uniref:AT3G52170-like helix-turn-helix domain-containing protein n=1 Tax=Dendrobium catenatum TaxID=906689 RepID=A0A2I0W2M8_9ASPA|nr:uncharacterized protein LOC110101053 [Dendrobium catenatum]XP_028554668.1 uncharacterized protein LOC110101053 [Dendrobium catenatum]XP_028554669.1 uncharacterized protein LOC110101053 [Dendrobium catenatum]XP_028554670.1 uncharacterized protein LOC110101053 [Dendrobium catenatum]PKU69912.1 hypothetical protein MA16_Dca026527 [Dendrobium catenatum]